MPPHPDGPRATSRRIEGTSGGTRGAPHPEKNGTPPHEPTQQLSVGFRRESATCSRHRSPANPQPRRTSLGTPAPCSGCLQEFLTATAKRRWIGKTRPPRSPLSIVATQAASTAERLCRTGDRLDGCWRPRGSRPSDHLPLGPDNNTSAVLRVSWCGWVGKCHHTWISSLGTNASIATPLDDGRTNREARLTRKHRNLLRQPRDPSDHMGNQRLKCRHTLTAQQ